MKRSERTKIYEKIAVELRKGVSNVHKISKATNINWPTVKIALDSLVAAGFIKLENKKYIIKNDIQFNSNSIMSLPITQDQINLFRSLEEEIQQKSPKHFNRTFLQKAIVQIMKKTKQKGIPYGWYLFGECTIVQLAESGAPYEKVDLTKFENVIRSTVDEFSQYNNTNELMEKTYEHKPLYQARLAVDTICKQEFTKGNLDLLHMQLKNIIFSFKETEENKDLFEFIEGFYSTFVQLLKLDVDTLEQIRLEIYKTYSHVWELIATYNIYEDTKDYFNITTKPYYNLRIETLKEMTTYNLLQLQGYLPAKKKVDDVLQAFKGVRADQSQ